MLVTFGGEFGNESLAMFDINVDERDASAFLGAIDNNRFANSLCAASN